MGNKRNPLRPMHAGRKQRGNRQVQFRSQDGDLLKYWPKISNRQIMDDFIITIFKYLRWFGSWRKVRREVDCGSACMLHLLSMGSYQIQAAFSLQHMLVDHSPSSWLRPRSKRTAVSGGAEMAWYTSVDSTCSCIGEYSTCVLLPAQLWRSCA